MCVLLFTLAPVAGAAAGGVEDARTEAQIVLPKPADGSFREVSLLAVKLSRAHPYTAAVLKVGRPAAGQRLVCRLRGELQLPTKVPITESVLSMSVGGSTCIQVLIRPLGDALSVNVLSLLNGNTTVKALPGQRVSVDLGNFAQVRSYSSYEAIETSLTPDNGVAFRWRFSEVGRVDDGCRRSRVVATHRQDPVSVRAALGQGHPEPTR
jgi:hypothetical protein